MEVGEQQAVDRAQRDFELPQPDGDAASGIDHQPLRAGLDQRARSEPYRRWIRMAGAKKGDAEIAAAGMFGIHRGSCIPDSFTTLAQCATCALSSAP